eukprot:scaffold1190_cov142-Amphora_coffeaeformis.AAC.2
MDAEPQRIAVAGHAPRYVPTTLHDIHPVMIILVGQQRTTKDNNNNNNHKRPIRSATKERVWCRGGCDTQRLAVVGSTIVPGNIPFYTFSAHRNGQILSGGANLVSLSRHSSTVPSI